MYSPHSVSMLLNRHLVHPDDNIAAKLAELTGKKEVDMLALLAQFQSEIDQVNKDYPDHDERYEAKHKVLAKYGELITNG